MRSRGRSWIWRTASISDCDGPLAVDGHDLGADGVVGRVEADGELGRSSGGSWAKRSMPGTMPEVETVMRRGLRPTSLDQQADGGHEVVVVEERLAHAHEDQIDAVAADFDARGGRGRR